MIANLFISIFYNLTNIAGRRRRKGKKKKKKPISIWYKNKKKFKVDLNELFRFERYWAKTIFREN